MQYDILVEYHSDSVMTRSWGRIDADDDTALRLAVENFLAACKLDPARHYIRQQMVIPRIGPLKPIFNATCGRCGEREKFIAYLDGDQPYCEDCAKYDYGEDEPVDDTDDEDEEG